MSNGFECCMGCTRRWVKDGKRCHTTCEDYLKAQKQNEKQLKDRIQQAILANTERVRQYSYRSKNKRKGSHNG